MLYKLGALAAFVAGVYTFIPDIRVIGAALIIVSIYLATRLPSMEAGREEMEDGSANVDQPEDEEPYDPRDEEHGDGREVGPVSRWITLPERRSVGAQ